MSYGLDNYANNEVSAPDFLFLTVLKLDMKKKENFPNGFYFCTRLDRYGRFKKPIGRFEIYFLSVMIYACNQNSRLQLNVF